MASKTLTTEAIALTEKKVDMSLDDIIKMSKNKTSKGKRPPRQPIKGRGSQNGFASKTNNKVQQFMDARSSVRQGVLAQRRSNFQGNQFQVTKQTARKAALAPLRSRPISWNNSRTGAPVAALGRTGGHSFGTKDKVVSKQKPQTLDARFAEIKEQRMKVVSQQARRGNNHQMAPRHNAQPQRRGRAGLPNGHGQFSNFTRAGASNGHVGQFSNFTRR